MKTASIHTATLTLGLLIGAGYALVDAVVHTFGERWDPASAVNPWQPLLADRAVVLFRVCLVVVMVGLIIGLVTGFAYNFYYGDYSWGREQRHELRSSLRLLGRDDTSLALSLGKLADRGAIVDSAYWSAAMAPEALPQDACGRGVLRQAGAVYQFRHSRLREYLAAQYHNKPKRLPSDG